MDQTVVPLSTSIRRRVAIVSGRRAPSIAAVLPALGIGALAAAAAAGIMALHRGWPPLPESARVTSPLCLAGIGFLLVASAVLIWLGRRVAAGMTALLPAVAALGASEPPAIAPAGWREARDLGAALAAAQRRIEQRDARLCAGESCHRAIVEAAFEAIVVTDEDGVVEIFNRAAEAMTGYAAADAVGQGIAALLPWRGAGEVEIRRKDGAVVPAELRLMEGWAGGRRYIAATLRDLTAQKREERSRTRLEAQLHHTQKMEAIGQLTDGIVHDFNNLLLAINLNLESLDEEIPAAASTQPLFDGARQAMEQARALIRQLLAFARRQPLTPSRLDVNRVALEVRLALRRILPASIEIETALARDADAVFADRNQLEAALLNLAINARDAMPAGGRLLIETANVTLDAAAAAAMADAAAGRYVLIAMTDSGAGMPPEFAARAFEPFFTTKEGAEHSGLGLSQVYGYVRQSGGHVALESGPGTGTTVKLFLPRSLEPARIERVGRAPGGRAGESILLVEDIPLVRRAVSRMLADLGYRVTAAASGEEALALIDGDGRIDLLFTDMVLPGGLGGGELAAVARRRRPGLRVLFTSGYTEIRIADLAGESGEFALIAKPYTKAELSERLRALLDRTPLPA